MYLTTALQMERGDEQRLAAFGLSATIFHDGLRAGATRAANRSSLALDTSPGTDIYHDGMESLAKILAPSGWRLLLVDKQPRLAHPDGIVTFAVSSGINVGQASVRIPRTRRKGTATRNSLAVMPAIPALFDDPDADRLAHMTLSATAAPFYLLLFERVTNGLVLEFSRPADMTPGGSVVGWADRIAVPFLDLEGDLSVFYTPGDDDFDVAVEPR